MVKPEDEGYHTAHTTVHFEGKAGDSAAVIHIPPNALSDVFRVGNTEIAQISSATATKYEASPSLKGRSTSLDFHTGDDNELKGSEQGGYIVTEDGTQEVHINLQGVAHGNEVTHIFEDATRPMAEIKADRDTGIAKLKYNLDHEATEGVKVVKTPGQPNVYICAKGDGTPLSTIIENNPQMAVKDPKTGKAKVHMLDGKEHHVVAKDNYDDCMKVLGEHLKHAGQWSKGVKITHTVHGEVPTEDWHASAHIKWQRPDFSVAKPAAPAPKHRSAVPLVSSATSNPNGSSAAYVVEPVKQDDTSK